MRTETFNALLTYYKQLARCWTTDHAGRGCDMLSDKERLWRLDIVKPMGVQELVICNSTDSKAFHELQHW